MTEAWIKRILVAAAAWNILGGFGSLLDPAQHLAQMYRGALDLHDPVQRFFFQTVWIAVIAWGAAYLAAAAAPAARAAVLLGGAAGKAAYFVAAAALVAEGTGTAGLLFAGGVDLAWAALFAYIVFVPESRADAPRPAIA